jgi:hypothetical protein
MDSSPWIMVLPRMIMTATKTKLVAAGTFDGLVPMSFGHESTGLQYDVLTGSDLYCARLE